jgi:alkaline phosphatase
MKLRNRLLAVFCLAGFVALGFIYFRVWVVPRTFGVILVMGDGLTMDQLVAARLYAGGATKPLAMERLDHLALIKNYSEEHAVPDTSAAVGAIATGVRVRNYTCSISTAGRRLDSLLLRAHKSGRSTGIVTTGRLTDAGVAPFYASTDSLSDFEDISAQLLQGGLVDVMLGGGAADFQPDVKGGKRQDGRDLMLELTRNKYTLVRNKQELLDAPGWPSPRVAGFFGDGPLAFQSANPQPAGQPRLSDMVQSAIQLLQNDRDGYFLVVHVGSITAAAEANDAENAILETLEMDRAISTIRAYAGDNTTVIACGLHGVGGMTVNGYPFVWQKGAELLGTNDFGIPSVTWSTGPNKTYVALTGSGATDESPKSLSAMAPSAFPMPRGVETAEDVIAVGQGPGTERLSGFLRHIDLNVLLRDQL